MRAQHTGMDFFLTFTTRDELLDLTTPEFEIPWQEVMRETGSPLRTGNGALNGTIELGGRTIDLLLQTVGDDQTAVLYEPPIGSPEKVTIHVPIESLRHVDIIHHAVLPYGKGDGKVRFSYHP